LNFKLIQYFCTGKS